MKKFLVGLVTGLLITALSCGSLWAQATAQISGSVRDQSGAVLPGVEVSATQTNTGAVRTTITNETGSYALPNLPIGPYRFEASLPGFRTFAQTGIVLQVNGSPVINAVLEVGQVAETVEVQANAALVETRNSGVGQVVENQRILELPLNGRDVTQLITLAGGAVSVGGETVNARNAGSGSALQVAGGLAYAVGYSLDGAPHLNTLNASSMLMPFPDALQEFKVETSGVGSSQGNSAGVSAVTKSGTNQIHGDLFEFVRNDLFNARQYFATTNSSLKRNQFGGTLGGPIMKDKLFFFGGYQGTILRQDPADVEAFVPTNAMLAGDFTAFASPACNAGRPLTLRAPFVNNRIDPALFSRAGLNIANRVRAATPAPLNECGLIRFGRPTKLDEWQTVSRIDYQRSSNHSIFGRYFNFHSVTPAGETLSPDNILNAIPGHSVFQQTFAIGDTYLISADTVNAFRFAGLRLTGSHLGSKTFNACDVGVNVYCGYVPDRFVLSVTSGFGITGSFSTGDRAGESGFTMNDDLSLVRGNHQISVGGAAKWAQSIVHTTYIAANRFSINGSVTGHGLGDLLTGRVSTLTAGGPYYIHMKQISGSAYATDTWKASPRLTMTGGVRWEPFFPQNLASGQGANFSYGRFQQGVKSKIYPQAPSGWQYPGDTGYPGESGMNSKLWNFGPSLGLAWDPKGDGKTSVRASFALGYVYVGAHWREDPVQQSPFAYGTVRANPAGGLDNPWSDYPGGNPFPITNATTFMPYGDLTTTPYDIKTPRTQTWNLSLQRQVASNWLVSAAYMGSLSYHIWIQDQINPGIFIPGGPCTLNGVTYNPCSNSSNTNQRRRFSAERPADGQFMGSVASLEDTATMNYHGMLLTVQRRISSGVNVNANYTWSHCIGDKVDLQASGPDSGETNTMPGNRGFDRGDCNGDRRQLFNLTSVAQTPEFSNPTMRKIATGWTLSGIYRRASGQPLDILAGSDRALNGVQGFIFGQQYQRGNQMSATPYADKTGGPLTNWLDRAAFDIPALGTLGNYRRNSVVGPATWSFDMALSRAFRFRESQRMEFRAEAFNVTNSFRPLNPNTTLTSAQFGQIRGSGETRIMQFALKYVF